MGSIVDQRDRDGRIDLLRLIGLLAIILAHVLPSGFIFQLRNFDVPLMVMISAMSFWLSYDSDQTYWDYVFKRIQRLVFPVWIFLAGYFSCVMVFDPESSILNLKTFLLSVLLVSGIGYVWIIRVFLIVSVLAPFVRRFYLAHGRSFLNVGSLLLIFGTIELMRYFSLPYLDEPVGKAFASVFLYGISYLAVFSVGLYLFFSSTSRIVILGVLFLGIFVLVQAWFYFDSGSFAYTQEFKYPPSVFYFSYSIAVVVILWLLMGLLPKFVSGVAQLPVIRFMASNSIWIYLWHIPFVEYVDASALIRYLVAVSFPTLIVFIQVRCVRYVSDLAGDGKFSRTIRRVLTG